MNFKQEINELTIKIEALRAEGKYDESVMEQIRLNVYHHVMDVEKYTLQESKDLKAQFLEIKGYWEESLELARKHNDFKTEHAELIKIETLNKIIKEMM